MASELDAISIIESLKPLVQEVLKAIDTRDWQKLDTIEPSLAYILEEMHETLPYEYDFDDDTDEGEDRGFEDE